MNLFILVTAGVVVCGGRRSLMVPPFDVVYIFGSFGNFECILIYLKIKYRSTIGRVNIVACYIIV